MTKTISSIFKATALRRRLSFVVVALTLFIPFFIQGQNTPRKVYDIDAAKMLCDELPLDNLEGIWLYPDDNVTVLVRRLPDNAFASLPEYEVMVVETTDCRMEPGDVIGKLKGSAEANKFTLILNTEKKKGIFGKFHECMATLSKDGESMILSREKSKFRLRINLNPNSLLPALWKSLVRFGVSVGTGSDSKRPAPGMVKLYPSYDGNGSSRNRPRYL